MLAILTSHTCGDACWHAREDVCRCSCGGVNHGILNAGGSRPERTSRKDGKLYVLAGVAPSYNSAEIMVNQLITDNFPGLDIYAYGDYRDELTTPILIRKASESQLRWEEVAAIQSDQPKYLVWRLPAGQQYITRASSGYGQNTSAPQYAQST